MSETATRSSTKRYSVCYTFGVARFRTQRNSHNPRPQCALAHGFTVPACARDNLEGTQRNDDERRPVYFGERPAGASQSRDPDASGNGASSCQERRLYPRDVFESAPLGLVCVRLAGLERGKENCRLKTISYAFRTVEHPSSGVRFKFIILIITPRASRKLREAAHNAKAFPMNEAASSVTIPHALTLATTLFKEAVTVADDFTYADTITADALILAQNAIIGSAYDAVELTECAGAIEKCAGLSKPMRARLSQHFRSLAANAVASVVVAALLSAAIRSCQADAQTRLLGHAGDAIAIAIHGLADVAEKTA